MRNIQKIAILTLTLIVSLTVVLACGKKPEPMVNNNQDNNKPCTMEAKVCPDGTSVGRGGPNCEFTPCPEIVKATTTEEIATSSVEIDTSDWNTYRNEEYGFELKYPNYIKISEENYFNNGWLFYLNFLNAKNNKKYFSFSIDKNLKNFDSEKVLFPIDRKELNFQEVNVGPKKYPARKITIDFQAPEGDINSLIYFIERNNKLFRLRYEIDNNELSQQELEKIISTLKFNE